MKKLTPILLRTIEIPLRFLALLASFALILVVFIMIGLQGIALYLNTESGGAWAARHLEAVTADTGYTLTLDKFSVAGLGLKAGSVMVANEDKDTIATATNLAIQINPFPLPLKRLSLSLMADEITVARLPQSSAEQEESAPVSLNIPDLYFDKIDIHVAIGTMTFSDAVIEGGFQTAFDLREQMRIEGQTVYMAGEITFDETQADFAQYVPDIIENDIMIKHDFIQIELLKARNDLYEAALGGLYDVQTQDIGVDMNGVFRQAGVDPIDFKAGLTGTINNFTGNVSAQTTYKNQPLTVNVPIMREGELITVEDMSGKGEGFAASGDLTYAMDTGLANGTVKADIPDLQSLNAFIPAMPAMTGQAVVNATIKDNTPRVQADLTNVVYDATTLQNADVTVTPRGEGFDIRANARGVNKRPFQVKADVQLEALAPLMVTIPSINVNAGPTAMTLKGSLKDEAVSLDLETANFDAANLPFVDAGDLPIIVKSLNASVRGTLPAPVMTANYVVSPTQAPDIRIKGQSTYQNKTFKTDVNANGPSINTATGTMSVPLTLSLQPFIFDLNNEASLDGSLAIDASLAMIDGLLPAEAYTITGQTSADITIGGTLQTPDINGSLQLKDANFTDEINDVSLNSINGSAAFSGRSFNIQSLSGTDSDGIGTFEVNGDIDLSNLTRPDMNASLMMDNMHLIESDMANAWLNADMRLRTQAQGYIINGTLSPRDVKIRLPERFSSRIPQLNTVNKKDYEASTRTPSLLSQIALDIAFQADQKIFVEGWGLDAEFGGNLDIKGTAANPQVIGTMAIVRGRYQEFGRNFTLPDASLRFQGTIPPSPYFNISAQTDVEDITAIVNITGNANDPKINLDAIPSMPEDEVLSLILFGKDIEQISPLQAIRLANTLRRFSGQGGAGFDPLQTLQDATGLDDIRVEGTGEDTTVGAGKYIADNVYVEVEKGASETSGAAAIEIELTPSVTVESRAGQNGDTGVNVFWEWEY